MNREAARLAVRSSGWPSAPEINRTSVRLRAERITFTRICPRATRSASTRTPIVGRRVPGNRPGGERPPKTIGITRAHLEEDAGRVAPRGVPATSAGIDLNRAGTPLLEIVSEPDMHGLPPRQCRLPAPASRPGPLWLGISDGNMQEGSFRCDANVSIRPAMVRSGPWAPATETEKHQLVPFRGKGHRGTRSNGRSTSWKTGGDGRPGNPTVRCRPG